MESSPMTVAGPLEHLEARQLIRGLTEAEPTYTFKHNLVQQAAYETLLAPDRRSLHRTVGEILERIAGPRSEDIAEVLASHYERAGDDAKALHYLSLAGAQAMRRFATAEAVMLYGRAIALSAALPFDETSLLHLYQQRGRALELRGDYATAMRLYGELEELGQERASPRLRLAGVIGATSLQAVPTPLFDTSEAMLNARRAIDLAEEIGDPASQAKAYWLQMLVQTRLDAKGAVASGIASLELAREHGLREQEAFTLNDIQSNYQVLGRPDLALQALEEARPIWQELDNLPMLADNHASTGMLHAIQAEYDQAIEQSREALAISERTGNLWGQSYGRIGVGLARFARGELGPAIREMTQCIEISELAGFVFPQVAMRSMLAMVYGQAGDLQTAANLARQVWEINQRTPAPGQSSGEATLAWIAVRTGDLDEAQRLLQDKGTGAGAIAQAMMDIPVPLAVAACAYHLARQDYHRALEVVDELAAAFETFQWRALQGLLLLTRARALKGLGRAAEARRCCRDAYDEMVRQGYDAGLWEVEAELAGMAGAAGETVEASDWYRRAADHIAATAVGLRDVGLDERFLAQPAVLAILQEAGPRSS